MAEQRRPMEYREDAELLSPSPDPEVPIGSSNPASVSTRSFGQVLKHFLSMQWWITAPLPLKVAYFGLACAGVFGLAAAIAGIEFGREAEDQVVEVTEDLLAIASLGGGPALAAGLISSFARRRTSGQLKHT